MKKTFLILILLGNWALALPTSSSSSSSSKRNVSLPLHIDLDIGGGYTKPTGAVTDGTLAQWILGTSVGIVIKKRFFIGGTSDYRFIAQYSGVDGSYGNLRGSRWNLFSPTLGVYLGKWILKVDYQFLGDYKLANITAANSYLSYTSPKGIRGMALVNLRKSFYVGLHYETITFGSVSDTASGASTLTPGLTLWQLGASLAYVI